MRTGCTAGGSRARASAAEVAAFRPQACRRRGRGPSIGRKNKRHFEKQRNTLLCIEYLSKKGIALSQRPAGWCALLRIVH